MDKYEFKERYNENAVLLARRGHYTICDFFNLAILRMAFTAVYGRGTGIYTCQDPEATPEEVRFGCMTAEEGYINSKANPTKEDVLATWDEYWRVIIPYPIVYEDIVPQIRNDLMHILTTFSSPMYGELDSPARLDSIFELFNQTWLEGNRRLEEFSDMREVLQHQKKIIVDGTNTASMMMNRLIEKWLNIRAMERAIHIGVVDARELPERSLGDHGYIVVIDKLYRISNIKEMFTYYVSHNHTDQTIMIMIQPSRKAGVIVSYYAKAVTLFNEEFIEPLKLYVPELIEKSGFVIKSMNDDGTAIGTFDLDSLIEYCQEAYKFWYNANVKGKTWGVRSDGTVMILDPENYHTTPEQSEEEPEEEDTAVPDRLKDPLADIIKEGFHKFKEGIINVWNSHKEPV